MPESCPLILESVIPADAIDREINAVLDAFDMEKARRRILLPAFA